MFAYYCLSKKLLDGKVYEHCGELLDYYLSTETRGKIGGTKFRVGGHFDGDLLPPGKEIALLEINKNAVLINLERCNLLKCILYSELSIFNGER